MDVMQRIDEAVKSNPVFIFMKGTPQFPQCGFSSTVLGNNITVDFDRKSNVHLTAGVLANLAFATLHAEANIAATNGVAVGISFGRQ